MGHRVTLGGLESVLLYNFSEWHTGALQSRNRLTDDINWTQQGIFHHLSYFNPRPWQSSGVFVPVITEESFVYTWSCILPTYKSKHFAPTHQSFWHILEPNNCHSALMFHCLTSGVSLHSHSTTPGCKETPAHRHLHSQHAADGEINHTADECWWFMGNCDSVVITLRNVYAGWSGD